MTMKVPRALSIAVIATVAGGASPPVPLPARSLMLAVAGWCAPCRVELNRIDEIADAAGPWRVRVVPIDRASGTRAMLSRIGPDRIIMSASVAATLTSMTGGLPFSVMTDDTGRQCARHNRPLDRDAVLRMRKECGG